MTDIFGAEAPRAGNVNDVLGIWASAARRKIRILKNNGEVETSGPFVQVSRLGLPLVNDRKLGLPTAGHDRHDSVARGEPRNAGTGFDQELEAP